MATKLEEDDAKLNKEDLSFKQRMQMRMRNWIVSGRYFLYDPEKSTILGNTPSSWIKVSVYYGIFYICLGLFFCGMVAVFGAIVSRQSPRYTYTNSEMNDGGNVYIGMGFRPMPKVDQVTISVYRDAASQNQSISALRAYQLGFLTQHDSTYLEDCSPTEPASELGSTRSCRFSWSDIVTNKMHPCSDSNSYGWPAGQPCVLIKLNKIYGWMPASGSVISQVENFTGQPVLPIDQREDNIYITCNGVDASDRSVLGNMTYYSLLNLNGYPSYGGIPYYFFPYLNSPEQVQPFVLVQFTSLPYDRSVNVECRGWAPNIQQLSQGSTLRGMTKFTLLRSNSSAPANS